MPKHLACFKGDLAKIFWVYHVQDFGIITTKLIQIMKLIHLAPQGIQLLCFFLLSIPNVSDHLVD